MLGGWGRAERYDRWWRLAAAAEQVLGQVPGVVGGEGREGAGGQRDGAVGVAAGAAAMDQCGSRRRSRSRAPRSPRDRLVMSVAIAGSPNMHGPHCRAPARAWWRRMRAVSVSRHPPGGSTMIDPTPRVPPAAPAG